MSNAKRQTDAGNGSNHEVLAMKTAVEGVINRHEAYSKATLLARLGISQKFWDKLLDDGLPYTIIGHTRWVTGEALINHLVHRAEHKHADQLPRVQHGTQT